MIYTYIIESISSPKSVKYSSAQRAICYFQAMNTMWAMRDESASSAAESPLKLWLQRHATASLTKYEQLEVHGNQKPLEFTLGDWKRFEAYIDPDDQFSATDKFSLVRVYVFYFLIS